MKNKKYDWKKCYKIDCSPAIEIFEDYVKIYGTNIRIEDLPDAARKAEEEAELMKEVIGKWQEEFGSKKRK